MQRFHCLFKANRPSSIVFSHLRRHGQSSHFSNFARHPQKFPITRKRIPPLQSSITRSAIYSPIAFPTRRLLSNTSTTVTPPDSSSPIAPQQTNDEFIPTDSPFTVDPYASSSTIPNPYAEIPPHPGYLHELGLDYGWGTTTLVQDVLEYAYIYGGASWGITLAGTVFAFRLVMFKFAADASDMAARLRATKEITADIDVRLKEAMYSGDVQARTMAVQEKQAVYKAAGVKFSKIFLNIAINIPIGFSVFRLMRGMAGLPVPGFEDGGFGWVMDLSVPDPYFVLPVITAGIFYWTFKYSRQSGEMAAEAKSTLVLFGYALPVLALVFGITFPAALQLTMLVTALTQASQSYILNQPGFRRFWSMHPLPEKKVEVPKVLNVKGRVVTNAGPSKPEGLVPRIKWHMRRVAKETQETSERIFPSQAKKAEDQAGAGGKKKKGPKRRV